MSNPPHSTRSTHQTSLIRIPQQFYGTNNKIIQFKLADIGEGISECELTKWFVQEGKEIQQFDNICLVTSDKATAEITSPYDGTVTKLYYQTGDIAKVGSPLVDIQVEGDVNTPEEKRKEASSSPAPPVTETKSQDHKHDTSEKVKILINNP